MKRAWTMMLAVAMVACGNRSESAPSESASSAPSETAASETASETAQRETATPAPGTETAPTPPRDAALEALRARAALVPFRWINTAPESGFPSEFGEIGATRRFDVSDEEGHTRRFEVTAEGVLSCRTDGTETWHVALADRFTGVPVLAGLRDEDGEHLVIAAPIEGAWVVELRDASDGAPRWHAVGGTGAAGVQLGVMQDLIALYVRRADSDETVLLRARDGITVLEQPEHPSASRFDPSAAPAEAVTTSRTVAAPSRITCVGDQCTLQREGVTGGLTWTSTVPAACRSWAVGGEGDAAVLKTAIFEL